MDDIDRVIATFDQITSAEDEDDLARLDQALQELDQIPPSPRVIDALFRIFERFPESDGYGVFWAILHALEAMPGYEQRLIESVERQPMEFNLTMVNRLLNAGITHRADVDLLDLLERVAANDDYTEEAREQARDLVEWQRNGIAGED